MADNLRRQRLSKQLLEDNSTNYPDDNISSDNSENENEEQSGRVLVIQNLKKHLRWTLIRKIPLRSTVFWSHPLIADQALNSRAKMNLLGLQRPRSKNKVNAWFVMVFLMANG